MKHTLRYRGWPVQSYLFPIMSRPITAETDDVPLSLYEQIEVFINHETLNASYVCPYCNTPNERSFVDFTPWYVCCRCGRDVVKEADDADGKAD